MFAYENVCLRECPLTRMSVYENVRLRECLLTGMSGYGNVHLRECKTTEFVRELKRGFKQGGRK